MRGYYERAGHGQHINDHKGDLIPSPSRPGTHRTPCGIRPTPHALREPRSQYWLRAAVITGIVLLAGTYMYYA